MAYNDWVEVEDIFHNKAPNILLDFINSDQIFLPNTVHINPFDPEQANFSAKQIEKDKPGNWIPLYKSNELSDFFKDNNIYPIRSGQAEFFFYKNSIFHDLSTLEFQSVDSDKYELIESFVPLTLQVNFQRNENAYLNKAVALGIINHFVDGVNYHILQTQIKNKRNTRLLYGQFGKIKITNPIDFKTSKGSKPIKEGFQFEIDLVLENENEIIIFEAKTENKPRQSFSLLQLYYPLAYFRQLTQNKKKIRTVFIDIVTEGKLEEYRLVEFFFENDCFDLYSIKQASLYNIK